MPKLPEFDLAAAHRYFAAHCFNSAWELIEKEDRTQDDDRLMVVLTRASIYHWMNRSDCDNQKLATGYWQASRVEAILKNGSESLRLAEICLSLSHDLPPFFLAYAHEALARASKLTGPQSETKKHLKAARDLVDRVVRGREQLEKDLAQIED